MYQKTKKRLTHRFILVATAVLFFFSCGSLSVFALDTDSSQKVGKEMVKREKDFEQKYWEHAASINREGFFNELSQADKIKIKEFFSLQSRPFADYQISFEAVQNTFLTGEEIKMNFDIKYFDKTLDYLVEVKRGCLSEISALKEKAKDSTAMDKVKALEEMNRFQEEIGPENFNNENPKEQCPPIDDFKLVEPKEVSVFAQIWRKDLSTENSPKGDYLVDEFYVKKGISLKNDSTSKIPFSWRAPNNLDAGKYYILVFLNQNERFTLEGLPAIAWDFGQRYDFNIEKNPAGKDVAKCPDIDKDNLKIGNTVFNFREPTPTIKAESGQINLEVPVKGISPEKGVTIHYGIYGWSQQSEEDLITQGDSSAISGSDGVAKFQIPVNISDQKQSLYHVKINFSDGECKSISNLRFVIEGRSRGQFDYLGFVSREDQKNYPYFCLRNKNWVGYFNGSVKISLLNEQGEAVSEFQRSGKLDTASRCFVLADNPIDQSRCFYLKGQIFDTQNNLVDSGESYSLCGAAANTINNHAASLMASETKNYFRWSIILAVCMLIVILGILSIYIKKKNENKQNQ